MNHQLPLLLSTVCLLIPAALGVGPSKSGQPWPATTLGTEEEPDGSKLAQVQLISTQSAFISGETNWIAAVFTIAPDWHLYWTNPGDSGGPISFKFDTPEGVTVGKPHFPTPKRKRYAGDSIDHIYTKELAVLFPVEIKQGSSAPITIRAEIDWLICSDECLAGYAETNISLPIVADSDSSQPVNNPVIARARDRLPLPPDQLSDITIRTSWNQRTLTIEFPGADKLLFFPESSDVFAYPEDLAVQGINEGNTLTIGYNRYLDDARAVSAVVEAHLAERVVFVKLDVPAPPNSQK